MATRDSKFLRANDARVEQHAKTLGSKLQRFLERFAREMADRVVGQLGKKGRMKLTKVADTALEAELLSILMEAGLRQVTTTGQTVAEALGGEFSLQQSLIDSIIRDKEIKVARIMEESRAAVQGSIKQILADAAKERPKPTIGALARRIKSQFHGKGVGQAGKPVQQLVGVSRGTRFTGAEITPTERGRLWAFSPERAALIARTESAQIENEATAKGMQAAGIKEMEWLARRDGRSGDRHHERMDGKRAKIGETFTTPLGNKLRWPGDSRAPIKDTANCRCTIVPVRRKKAVK